MEFGLNKVTVWTWIVGCLLADELSQYVTSHQINSYSFLFFTEL